MDVLAAGTKTEAGTEKLYQWGSDNLGKVTLPLLPLLRKGEREDVNFGNWLVALRPVRAEQDSCLGCHAGAKRGDTLGVMVYAVDKNANSARTKAIQAGFN